MFSETFIQILIIGSLIWTALGALTLLALLVSDTAKKSIW
jgi:hypothetical protein